MRVGVVGAGIAGLRAAQLLEKAGAEVFVFEARDRLGGRLKTERLETGWFESGGEWIDADHKRVIALLKEFGQLPEVSKQWPGRVLRRGAAIPEDEVWPEAASDLEAIHAEAVRLCQSMPANPAGDPEWARLDQQTLSAWLDQHCRQQIGRWLAEGTTRSDEGEDTKRVGLLGWLLGYRHYLDRAAGDMSAYRLPHGGEDLCRLIAHNLQHEPELGKPLTSVEVQDGVVALWLGSETVIVDRCVLTLPPVPLSAVEFPLEFPDQKRQAWQIIGNARAIKVSLEFKRKFWLDRPGWSGRMLADLPFQQVWDAGREGAVVMSAYICGDEAEWVLRRADPVQTILSAITEVFAEADGEFVRGWVFDWISDKYSSGAFTSLCPGSVCGAMPFLADAWGPVHFAGEYTSSWTGFVEGALESADRVVSEIMGL